MRERLGKETQKEIIIRFIQKNPKATYKEIRKETKLHPERIFKSLKEAFEEANIKPPRTFDIKSKDEKKKIIIEYIKKNPLVGGHTIKKDTKINFQSVFKDTSDAFEAAGIVYPRKIDNRKIEEKKQEIIRIVRENPLITIPELMRKSNSNPYRFFKDFKEIYAKSGIKEVNNHDKRVIKKQRQIIEYIKNHPLATQREINKECKTHVQEMFSKGILEAYEHARINFPFERLKLYGVGIKNIRDRAKSFEEEIALKLSGYGKVNRLVKTKTGFADIIFERKDKKIIIEIKDYFNKEISISQIKQLNRYLEDCKCTVGILICHKKPKKDKFLMNENTIFILTKEELDKIPKIASGS